MNSKNEKKDTYLAIGTGIGLVFRITFGTAIDSKKLKKNNICRLQSLTRVFILKNRKKT